jgi:hypothetical protein
MKCTKIILIWWQKCSYMTSFNFFPVFVFILQPCLKTKFISFLIFFIGLIFYIFKERFAIYDMLLQMYSDVILFGCSSKANYRGETLLIADVT